MSALEQCIALETEELKLRCFEAIIASGGTGSEEEVTTSNSSVAAALPPEEAVPDTVGEPDHAVAPGLAANASLSVVSAVESDPDAASTAVSAAVVGTSLAALSNAATAAPENEDEVGKEHLRQPEKLAGGDDALLRATVLEVTKGRNDILHFQMDNGQVWRQNEARHFSYPKNRVFDVSISRGVMGDYRLRIGDNGRMVRIRRVK